MRRGEGVGVRVVSDNGYGDVVVEVKKGGVDALKEAYAKEMGVPVGSFVMRCKESGKRLGKERKISELRKGVRAKINGLPALKCLFDCYDNVGKVPEPNQRQEVGTVVKKIVFGKICIDTWNPSPYPRFINTMMADSGVLFICDVCLRYSPVKSWMESHVKSHGGCAQGHHPPGKQIFTSTCGTLRVWEVDGGVSYDTICEYKGLPTDKLRDIPTLRDVNRRELFSQHAALLARFFLKGKSAFYGTGSFLFYVLTEFQGGAWRFRGYFSVDKGAQTGNSLACIMVLPPWQDKGYGRLLIHLSYMLCRPKSGGLSERSPERPLSDLGMCTFLSYWRGAVYDALAEMAAAKGGGSWQNTSKSKEIDSIVRRTVVRRGDVYKALHNLGVLSRPGVLNSEIDWEAVQDLLDDPNVKPVRHELRYFTGSVLHDTRLDG